MRKRISESNIFPEFDLYTEYSKIEYLLTANNIIGGSDYLGTHKRPSHTLEEYIDQVCFSSWHLRGTFLSLGEMRIGLAIEKESFDEGSITEEKVLDFLQFALNCILCVESTIKKHQQLYIADDGYIKMLNDNILALLNKLNAEVSIDRKKHEVFVVYSNEVSSVVSEGHPEIACSITEYMRVDNHGDLKRKGEILCTLFKSLEPIEKKFKGTEYASLVSDTTMLFNKTGARHWTENDKLASATFLKMTPEELETWYDKTYTMFLCCMVTSTYLDIKPEVKKIKQSIETTENS